MRLIEFGAISLLQSALEYILNAGLCLLEVATDLLGAYSRNNLLVCIIGLLLSSAADCLLSIYLFFQGHLVPYIIFTACYPYNQIRKGRNMCVICM